MGKKTAIIPVLSRSEEEEEKMPPVTHPRKRRFASWLWLWLVAVLVVGAVVLIVVSSIAGYWLQNANLPTAASVINPTATTVLVTTLNVGRTAPYAGLDMTVVNAQYATSFDDDNIQSGAAIVRLNMQIANHTTGQISVVYYMIAHLIAPHMDALAPTNVLLSTGPKPGKSESGWIDFSVAKNVPLNTLSLQFGSTVLNESLVTIPLTGKFNASQYADRVSRQDDTYSYYFSGGTLNYRLTSVETRFDYEGNQAKADKQFYILNFQVANPNGVDISPGYGFDYLRMVVNGYGNPPVDNTLPYTFGAGKTVNGRVVFSVQSGLHNFSLRFLSQTGNGAQDYGLSV
jgi:hypothetical protein